MSPLVEPIVLRAAPPLHTAIVVSTPLFITQLCDIDICAMNITTIHSLRVVPWYSAACPAARAVRVAAGALVVEC